MQCASCAAQLGDSDAFCGNCGAQTRPLTEPAYRSSYEPAHHPGPGARPDATDNDDTVRLAPDSGAPSGDNGAFSGRFFQHAPRRAAGRPGNTTRYLSAAAYLNPAYANRVIGELVASRRAVAPSIGFDLGPVIRHCLNSRSIQLARDVLLTALLVLSLVLATVPTIMVILVAFVLGFLPSKSNWDRHSGVTKIFTALVAIAVIIVVLVFLAGVLSAAGSGLPAVGLIGPGPAGALVALVYAALVVVTVFGTTYKKYRILAERLRPDADAGTFPKSAQQVESRVSEVEAAQHGNVTLYAGENPFIGTGRAQRAWSIAIELDRAAPAGPETWMQRDGRATVPIDPVELHAVIRERLLKLKDPGLPENERVSALEVYDHVVGEGRGRHGPLMDATKGVPYSVASQEAITALIRHPQAGLRYYQRVCVNDEGQPVHSGGQQVLARTDQEISVSAFVHVAVEGRMLYVEFVATVLPPVQRRYHVIDLLARLSPGKFLSLVLTDGIKELFASMIGAPFAVIGTLRLMARESHADEDEIASVHEFLEGDSGARVSVRELAAARSTQTFLQELDTAKYTKIIERLLNDTVLDFLAMKGIDTTAYRASANIAINNGTVIAGGTVNGAVVGGLGVTANVTQAPAAAPASAPG